MKSLVEHLDKRKHIKFVIIFDDFSRFARYVGTYLKLKFELISRVATLECLNFNFEDSPEGNFSENIMASSAQYQREGNRRQVIDKQRARLISGY